MCFANRSESTLVMIFAMLCIKLMGLKSEISIAPPPSAAGEYLLC